MQSSKCISSTASALRRVFISPIELSRTPFLLAPRAPQHISRPAAIQRTYATQAKPRAAPREERLPIDNEIKARVINVVDESNTFHADQDTRRVLASINRETHILMTVSMSDDGEPPICKIISKQALLERQRQKREQAKAPKPPALKFKTIELNWAIDGNDLGHRLDKMKEFLAKGWKVDVLIAGKRKGRQASREECAEVLERVKELTEADGVKEWKVMEGKIGGQLTVFLEGKLKKEVVQEDDLISEKQERTKAKHAKKEARREAKLKAMEDVKPNST